MSACPAWRLVSPNIRSLQEANIELGEVVRRLITERRATARQNNAHGS